MTSDPQGQHRTAPTPSSSTTLVVSATLIVFGILAAGVFLAFAGWQTASIIGLLTAVGTVAGGLLVVLPKLVSVQNTVEQVAHQTNGQLRQHITQTGDDIAAQVTAQVLAALGHTPAAAPPPAVPRLRARGAKRPTP